MPREKLTKTYIERLPAQTKTVWITDTECPSLVLRAWPGGKSFCAHWRSPVDGRQKRPTIARYGEISIDEARRRAKRLVAEDGETRQPRETLEDVWPVWVEEKSGTNSEEHMRETERVWRLHLQPAFGRTKLSRLTPRLVQKFYREKQREGYAAATLNRWIAALSAICSVARKEGWMTHNPVEGVEKTTARRRLDVFTREDFKSLADNLVAAEPKHPIAVALIRFLMLHPARGKEARMMRWDALDLKNGLWTIAAENYKSRKAKVFPLGPDGADFLRRIRTNPWSDEWVFPSPLDRSRPVRKEHQRDIWKKVRPKPLGAHTLRRSIATMLINRDVSLEIVSALLGHSSVLVTQQVYAHLDPAKAGHYLAGLTQFEEDIEVKADSIVGPALDFARRTAIAKAESEE